MAGSTKKGFSKRTIFCTKPYPCFNGETAVDLVQEVIIGDHVEYSAAILTDKDGHMPMLIKPFEEESDAIDFVKGQAQYPGEDDEASDAD